MALYLLDTNIVSSLLKYPRGLVAQRIEAVGESAIATSIIVAAELRFGAVKRQSPLLTTQVEAIPAALTILPLQPPADIHYGSIRTALEQAGKMIGGNDLLIAAQAIALSRVLVTANTVEFTSVSGLKVENWLV